MNEQNPFPMKGHRVLQVNWLVRLFALYFPSILFALIEWLRRDWKWGDNRSHRTKLGCDDGHLPWLGPAMSSNCSLLERSILEDLDLLLCPWTDLPSADSAERLLDLRDFFSFFSLPLSPDLSPFGVRWLFSSGGGSGSKLSPMAAQRLELVKGTTVKWDDQLTTCTVQRWGFWISDDVADGIQNWTLGTRELVGTRLPMPKNQSPLLDTSQGGPRMRTDTQDSGSR